MKRTLFYCVALALTIAPLVGGLPLPAEGDTNEQLHEEVLHRSAPNPVEIALAAAGPFSPGTPVDLEATLLAQWADLEQAHVVLETPDAVSVNGARETTLALVKGEAQDLRFELVPDAPGLHELRLTVSGASSVGTLGGARTAYLFVEDGGDGAFTLDLPPVTGAADATTDASAPVGLAQEAAGPPGEGPAKRVAAPADDVDGLETGEPASDGSAAPNEDHSTFQVKVCWFYRNEADTADLPQRFATVEVWDDDTFGDQLLDDGVTGSNGCFTSGNIPREEGHCCATGNQDVYVRIHLCNTWVCTHDGDGDFWRFRIDFGTVGSQDLIDLGSFKAGNANGLFAQRQFQYANNAGWAAVNVVSAPGFSSAGPQVTLEAPSDDGSCGGMFIRRAENRIYVCADSDNSPDDVGHEYGHFLQWKLYEPFWPSPGGPHNLCTDGQDRGLAWAEGFGNWFGPFADWQASPAPGATGDLNYNRPWDGSGFSINMETGGCTGTGDDNEMRVAHTLWDMVDTPSDGTDTSDTTAAFLVSVISACNDSNFRDFYDGGSCTWTNQGGNACDLVPAAFQNNVDFNDNTPVGTLTSQTGFAWVKDTITLSATVTDADGFGCPLSADFYISHDSNCNASDTSVGLDTSAPFSRSFDTNAFADDGSVWTCVLSSDGMEAGTSDTSAMFGVDNTDPNVGLSASGAFQNGWFRTIPTMTLGCGDALSGVASIEYVVDAFGPFTPYTAPFQITGEGVHTLIMRCTDNAGNVDVDVETIRIDTVDPTTTSGLSGTLGNNGWYVSPVEVSLTCTDPTPGSGCVATQVATSDGIFNCGCPFTVSTDGMHSVAYHSADLAGNVDPTGSVAFDIDQVAPALALTGASDGNFTYDAAALFDGVFTNDQTLDVHYDASDATSGVFQVRATGVSDTFAGGVAATSGTLTLTLPAGVSSWTVEAEDIAGHVVATATFEVVSVPAGTFDGGVDPRGFGFWKKAVQTGAYTEAEIGGFLELINAVSAEYGVGDTFGELTVANYQAILDMPKPPSDDDKVSRSLLTAWLNLASGREPAAQAVDLSPASTWEDVVQNTGGSPLTTALNTIQEAESTYDPSVAKELKNSVKDVLDALSQGSLNV